MNSSTVMKNEDDTTREIERKVITMLNKELGSEAKNLSKIEVIIDKLRENKTVLEQKLEYLSSTTPDKLNEAMRAADAKIDEAEDISATASKLEIEVKDHQKRVSKFLGSVEQQLQIIQQNERVTVYQHWVSAVQQLSLEMVTLSSENNETELLLCFNQLEEYHNMIAGKTSCLNLQEYVEKTLMCWHQKLLQDFSKEFESVLDSLHYPFIDSNKSISQVLPTPEMYERLGTLTKHLLTLCDSKYSTNLDKFLKKEIESQYEGLLVDFKPLITPLQLLLNPFEARFLYHFSGDVKTNSAAHPEWCFTKVLGWINGHHSFYYKHIQSVLNENGYGHLNAKAEITRGLIKLTMVKLSKDMKSLMEDEDMFCHCLQETLNFERELAQSCGYPSGQPSVLGVLTQPHVLSHWLSLERKFAVALMDELVSMSGAWDPMVPNGEGQEAVSSCGEHLVTLLQGVTDRYKTLPQPGHRLQFLEVQVDVLDEFRVRSAQLARECLQSPINSIYPSILNTLKHVSDTLTEWADVPMFLELQMYQNKQKELEEVAELYLNLENKASPSTKTGGEDGVFSSCLSLYLHMEEEMLNTLQYHLKASVRNRGVPYRRDKWFIDRDLGLGSRKDALRIEDVSPSLCPLLEILISQLTSLHETLSGSLFTEMWQAVATDLDKFLYEEVILQNNFSELGAAQMQHDLTKALYPLFSEYTVKPQGHFKFTRESMSLLSLPRPTAMLLRDTLKLSLHGSGERDLAASSLLKPVAALAEHGVTLLNVEQAYTVLNRRTNMTTF